MQKLLWAALGIMAALGIVAAGCSRPALPPIAPALPPAEAVEVAPAPAALPPVVLTRPVTPRGFNEPASNVPSDAPAPMVPQPDGLPPDINRGYVPAETGTAPRSARYDSEGLPPNPTQAEVDAEAKLSPEQQLALDKPRFVQSLRWQERQIERGRPAVMPYRIDAAGNILHIEPDGSLRPVSDHELEYPSAAQTQEANDAVKAAQAQ